MEGGIQILNNALTDIFQLLQNDIVGVAWEKYVKEKTS